MLRQAVIDSVFNCHSGDAAAQSLRRILGMETDDAMRRRLIDAMARTRSSAGIAAVAEIASKPGANPLASYAVETLGRAGALNRAAATNALRNIVKGAMITDPTLAAQAQDALDALVAPAGQTDSTFNIQRPTSNVQRTATATAPGVESVRTAAAY